MSQTIATPTMTDLARGFKAIYSGAVISGIVPDPDHEKRGGYHVGRKFNPPDNYSVVRPDDQYGPGDASAAIDMTLSAANMITCTRRLINGYTNVADPRRKYINAFNGWLGAGDATRYDFYARKKQVASADHKWHVHLEVRRKYVNSAVMLKAVLSLLRGETVAQYMASIGVAAPAKAVTAAAVAVPSYPGRVLRRDDNMKPDADVKRWQARMIARGWKSLGTADGRFGPNTESVVKKFQAACKVAVDGEIGRVTWALPWSRPLGS